MSEEGKVRRFDVRVSHSGELEKVDSEEGRLGFYSDYEASERRVAELEAELTTTYSAVDDLAQLADKKIQRVAELEAQNAELAKEAELWRWCAERKNQTQWTFGGGQSVKFSFPPEYADLYDFEGCIRAALASQKGEKG